MGLFQTKQDTNISFDVREYTCDTVADVAKLPTDASPGSTAIVIENSSVYMLNTQHEWKELA